MSITLIATPGASDANVYVTSAQFSFYVSTRLHNSAAVTGATGDTVARALVTATRLLDEQIEWDEETWPTVLETQALAWPREGMYDLNEDEIDNNVIPQKLKDACCELAIYQIDGDLTAANSAEGMEGITVGSIDLRFSTSNPKQRKVIPDAAFEMISQWGDRRFGSKTSVRLERA